LKWKNKPVQVGGAVAGLKVSFTFFGEMTGGIESQLDFLR